MRAIIEGSATLFDPDVVDAFCKVVAPFPAGTSVELTDGRKGIVVSVPDQALDRPVVRIVDGEGARVEVALLLDPNLAISGWDHTAAPSPVAA